MSVALFSSSPAGLATAASQAKYATAPALVPVWRVRGDELLGLPAFAYRRAVDWIDKRGYQVRYYARSGGQIDIAVSDTNNGTAFLTVATGGIVAGRWYVIRAGVGSGGVARARMFWADGSADGVPVLAEASQSLGVLDTTAGGTIAVGGDAFEQRIDGLQVWTSTPADSGICAVPPATAPSGRIAYYSFESSPATDHDGGTALTLTNVSLVSGGVWDLTAPPPLVGAARHARLRTTRGRARRAPLSFVPVSRAPLPWSLVPPTPLRVLRPLEQLRPMFTPREEFA